MVWTEGTFFTGLTILLRGTFCLNKKLLVTTANQLGNWLAIV